MRTATATRTSFKKYNFSRFCNSFAIIPICLTWKMLANSLWTKLVWKKVDFTVIRSHSRENLKFGHFTLLFCRGRQRNVPKCKTHVQSDCFSSLSPLFCGVLVTVAVLGCLRDATRIDQYHFLEFKQIWTGNGILSSMRYWRNTA